MTRILKPASLFTALLTGLAVTAQDQPPPGYDDIDQPPHDYWKRPLKDPFTKFKDALESGNAGLDHTSEKAFMLSVLKALGIPASSQLLVFSTTSLQLRLITPRNPRALYFNEEIYVGYIPGGQIEVVSLDPEIGAVFYIFDVPRGGGTVRVDRSTRCMNCHASDDTGHVPGLLVKSVVPGPTGGSLKAFRIGQMGHGVPFEERFGGWYLTGRHGFTNHWANTVGRSSPQGLMKNPVEPGQAFDYGKYPAATSDVLAHLLHEHQAGFVNRVVEAGYRARTYLHQGRGSLSGEHAAELDRQAGIIARYLLFADEVSLPAGGVEGDETFRADFLRDRKTAPNGASLKDFDLRTRLFRHRCSYMIYSGVFEGLSAVMKQRIHQRLDRALNTGTPDAEYDYLPRAEKQAIREILKATLKGLPEGW